jgi:sec-independent protein translocase protein TatA
LVLINSIDNFDGTNNINFKENKLKKMGNLGATEIILILLVVVLLFGGRKIPELMKGIGQGMKEFKKASRLEDEDKSNEHKEEEKKA